MDGINQYRKVIPRKLQYLTIAIVYPFSCLYSLGIENEF